jgi:arsenate reductase (glutaredoxin)
MPKSVAIYHNPKCTKSRETLALLREHGVEPKVIEYLKEPPSAAQVKALISALGIAPHELLRTKEEPYKAHALSKSSSADAVAKAIAADPILLERPVVVVGKKAVIGRPPENVLPLLK